MPWIGKHNAVCFTECPWASLITHTHQYSSYGIGFTKNFIFSKGGGPVYYVRNVWRSCTMVHALSCPIQHQERPVDTPDAVLA